MVRETGRRKKKLSTLNVTIRHDLVDGLLRKAAIRMPHPSKKNTAADLRFAKQHLNKSQDFWNNTPFLLCEETR